VQRTHLEFCDFEESLVYVGHGPTAPPSYLPASILMGADISESMLITSTRCTHKAGKCQVDNECQPLEQSPSITTTRCQVPGQSSQVDPRAAGPGLWLCGQKASLHMESLVPPRTGGDSILCISQSSGPHQPLPAILLV
jgi:hypothetical protein